MSEDYLTRKPDEETDEDGARRVLQEFIDLYQPTLIAAQNHLNQMIFKMAPDYSAGYKPWHSALQDLTRGLYMMSKNIPLPDIGRFMDALHMFSFEGAVRFICDLCKSCKINLPRDWEKQFREHVDRLLFSITILNRNMENTLGRG